MKHKILQYNAFVPFMKNHKNVHISQNLTLNETYKHHNLMALFLSWAAYKICWFILDLKLELILQDIHLVPFINRLQNILIQIRFEPKIKFTSTYYKISANFQNQTKIVFVKCLEKQVKLNASFWILKICDLSFRGCVTPHFSAGCLNYTS